MNPRQRRGVLLMALAALGAIAAFVMISSYVADVRAQVTDRIPVLRLNQDVDAYDVLHSAMVETEMIPQRWAPEPATIVQTVEGYRAAAALPAGTLLQQGMLVQAPALRQGEQEIAVLLGAETGVFGKVQPNSRVDIFATFEGAGGTGSCAGILIAGARVLEKGDPAEEVAETDADGLQAPEELVVPVTFALRPRDALKLVYAESFATEVRIGLRSPLDALEPATPAPVVEPTGCVPGRSIVGFPEPEVPQ